MLSLMRFLKILLVVLSLVVCSCSTVRTTVVPITNSFGELVFLQPSRFQVSESMRSSDVMRLNEDIITAMPDNFPSNLVPLDPDRGEVVVGAFGLIAMVVQEKGKEGPTGVVAPVGLIKSTNVSRARIEAVLPNVQGAYVRQLTQHGRLILESQVVAWE